MLNFNHKAKVFKDETLQNQFNNEGFVVLDLLNTDELDSLNAFYLNKHPEALNGFYTSTFAKDTDYRKEVDAAIQAQMKRNLENYFFDYKIHCGSFIVKGADEKSVLKMHQDMTLVDESIYTGINIWIPLIDLNTENGAIEVLPRSHRLFKTYRGASLPDIYDGIEESVYKLMTPQYLKAGQAIIFDQSIIHSSPANKSNQARPVINTFITHKDAGIQICYWDKTSNKNEVEIFAQEPDFMVNFQNFGHDIFNRPSIGRSIGFVPFNFPKITSELLQKEYGLRDSKEKNSIAYKKRPFFELFKKIFTGS
jgi:hypothetical protein